MKAKAVLNVAVTLSLLTCVAVWAQTPPAAQPEPSQQVNAIDASEAQAPQVDTPDEQSKRRVTTRLRKELRKNPNGDTVERTIDSITTPDGKTEEVVAREVVIPKEQVSQLPEELPDTIAAALRNNGDIQVAEAKLRMAEAELRRTRQEVAAQTTEIFQDLKWARDHAKACQQKFDNGTVDSYGLATAMRELAGLESRLRSLVGLIPEAKPQGRDSRAPGDEPLVPSQFESTSPGSPAPSTPAARVPRPPIPDRYQEALDKPIKFKMGEGNQLEEMLPLLSEQTGIQFVGGGMVTRMQPIALSLDQTPLRQVLQAISEVYGGHVCFMFRDYGILMIDSDQASGMTGATIPEYIPYTGP